MIARVLARAEWPLVKHTEIGPAIEVLPAGSQILVVEDGGQVVGEWALLPYYHVEGLWIDPAYRKHGAVGRRLLTGMRRLAKTVGAKVVWTGVSAPDVAALLEHYGAHQIPGVHYVMYVGGGD